MLHKLLISLSLLDVLAVIWFFVCWIGYSWLADRAPIARHGLIGASHTHRLAWAKSVMRRGLHVADAALVGNLMHSVSFYASTTIYVLAGLLALMGTVDKVMSFAADLPFMHEASRELWELKLLLLVSVFVVAYFKFTWSLRQFNFFSILLGATPPTDTPIAQSDRYAERLAKLNSYAGDEFNSGIRAYYFGLAAIAWFIQPAAVFLTTSLVVFVLYRRDFASPALDAMRE
ncbi:DUF599 domain-containing protein [Leeia oryzae]|uniref:DUF599 domain-containing protein n=1 Tax=Leeia oryzae TaxID=356662 RepID=UPI000369AC42|nr:DUF599 domain-containing protein [Leeia oryzae]